MIQKILKIEFLVLFLLSLVSVFYYFFSGYLPDNSLLISSASHDYYTWLYYFSSVLAEISFFVGPWICALFLMFSFLYSFILSSRNKEGDTLLFFSLGICFYSFTFLIFPEFLGEGLLNLSNEYVPLYVAFLNCVIFCVLSFYLILRRSFFILVRRLQLFFERIGAYGLKKTMFLAHSTKSKMLSYTLKVKPADLRRRTIKLIKESVVKDSINRGENKVSNNKNVNSSTQETLITPRISETDFMQKSAGDLQSDTTLIDCNDGEFELERNISASKKSQTIRPEPKQAKAFFKSRDLIDCITANTIHTQVKSPDENYFQTIITAIEDKLSEFKLDGKIINILKGPVVDTFELELGTGVKVSKVTGLSDDIGLALNGAPIRIVYPMRGKPTMGIEVPRNPREFIFLDEVLHSDAFNDSEQRLPIAMGKDAFGDVKVVDLAGMPHMLVAGATGAGKSVFINSLLVSLVIKKSPSELKLILIDPKQLELALFSVLPHLMLPVITDPTSSAVALLWAVQEMDKRYTILKEMGVKNIEGFNKKVKTCDQSILFKINHYYEDRAEPGYELPYIVIVIDEFADLILSKAGKEIENNVNRLAAKARAAGIHLVVATQRPSTDVVTGVVKANFPTRVAFRVSTGHDSKTILDQYGAEKLLGKGDMLYKHGVDLIRMHSSFVDESEVEGLIEKLGSIASEYNQSAMDFLETGGDGFEDEDESLRGSSNFTSGTSDDPMYDQALEVVMENGSASASMIQRRLRVGYNRAANIVEEMERHGIVGPAQGSKPRKVIAKSE